MGYVQREAGTFPARRGTDLRRIATAAVTVVVAVTGGALVADAKSGLGGSENAATKQYLRKAACDTTSTGDTAPTRGVQSNCP